jgi:hypothetical protein
MKTNILFIEFNNIDGFRFFYDIGWYKRFEDAIQAFENFIKSWQWSDAQPTGMAKIVDNHNKWVSFYLAKGY